MIAVLRRATAGAALAALATLSAAPAFAVEERQGVITVDGAAGRVLEGGTGGTGGTVRPVDEDSRTALREPSSSPPPAAPTTAVPGRLAGAPTDRELGLPTAVAAVLVAGVASLLLRLLLAEPVLPERRGTG